MKRFFLLMLPVTAIALCISPSAFAQQGKMAVGAHFGWGSGPTFGLGGKFQYGISDPIRLEGSVTSFWGGGTYTSISGNDLSVNVHYLFSAADFKWNRDRTLKNPGYVYPLVGLGYYRVTAKADFMGETAELTERKIGVNIGVGVENYFNDKVSIFTEMKLGLGSGLSRFTWLCGVAYHF